MEWWQLKEEYLKPIGGFLLLPYVLYKEIREQVDLWKAKGHSRAGGRGEAGELRALIQRLGRYREAAQGREALVQGIVRKLFADRSSPEGVATARLLSDIIDYEGFLSVPDIDLRGRKLSTSEIWETSAALMRALHSFEKPEALAERLEGLVRAIVSEADLAEWQGQDGKEAELSVPLYTLLPDPAHAVERILGEILTEDQPKSLFFRIWLQLKQNLYVASGIDPAQDTSREPIWPRQARMETRELIGAYLGNTPFASFLQTSVPFGMPFSARFEHTHIVGGSGHGKTQLLQQMILKDLAKLEDGKGSVIVIDSQGDLLRNILSLASMASL